MTEIVPYKNTLQDLIPGQITDKIAEKLHGKYFQNKEDPSVIAYFPNNEELQLPNLSRIRSEARELDAWFPLQRDALMGVAFDEFQNYVEIPKEQFKKYEKNPTLLSSILLFHENSEEVKKHKANLSAQKKVDKGKERFWLYRFGLSPDDFF